jgi:hypothetical protein
MNLSEEEINQYRECPKKHIVYPIRHWVLFLVLRCAGHMLVDLLFRHFVGITTMDRMGTLGDLYYEEIVRHGRSVSVMEFDRRWHRLKF